MRMGRISQVIIAILAEGGGAEEDTSRSGICKSEGFTTGISSMWWYLKLVDPLKITAELKG